MFAKAFEFNDSKTQVSKISHSYYIPFTLQSKLKKITTDIYIFMIDVILQPKASSNNMNKPQKHIQYLIKFHDHISHETTYLALYKF